MKATLVCMTLLTVLITELMVVGEQSFASPEPVEPEEMEVLSTDEMPGAEIQSYFAKRWHVAPEVRSWLGEDSPFREGVEFGRVAGHDGFVIRENGVYAPAHARYVGHFLTRIKDSRQCSLLLGILHKNWAVGRLSAAQVRRILLEVECAGERLPFKILKKEIDEHALSRGCAHSEGIWLADFVVVEDGCSLVEYKYTIDRRNGLKVLRNVLIRGPRYCHRIVGETAEFREYVPPDVLRDWNAFPGCRHLLDTAAELRNLRESLADTDPVTIAASICALARSKELTKSDLPELRKALKSTHDQVRRAAVEAIESLGPDAMDAADEE